MTETLNEILPEGFAAGVAAELGKTPEDVGTRLAEFKSVEDITKSYLHLHSKSGNSISVPTEKSSQSEILEYRKTIGAPENKDGYAFPEDTDPGTKSMLDGMRAVADANHLTTKQWESMTASLAESKKAGLETIQAEWAKELSGMTENQGAIGDRFARQVLSSEAFEALQASGFDKMPALARAMAEMGAADARGMISADTTAGGPVATQSSDIDKRLAEIRSDPDYIGGERGPNPQKFRELQKESSELNALKYAKT